MLRIRRRNCRCVIDRDRFTRKRLWTDEIVIYCRLKETLPLLLLLQLLLYPKRALFFLIRYCWGLTDCSRTDPSGSRSIFLVPKHEKGPLATRYIVVPIHIHIYIPCPRHYCTSQFPRIYIYIYIYIMCGRGRSPHWRNSCVNRYAAAEYI
jgi:hypothetical protein